MLRAANSGGRPQPARTSRVVLLGALVVASLLAAGLRTPLLGKTPKLVEEGGLQGKDKQPLTGEFIPANAVAAAAVRIPDLLRLLQSDELRALADNDPGLKPLGISIKDLDEFKIGLLDLNQGPGGPTVQTCVRSLKPFDWLKAMQKRDPVLQEAEFGGVKYLTTRQPAGRGRDFSYFMPDERTLIGAPEARIRELIQNGGKGARPVWAESWDTVSNGPIVGILNVEVIGKYLDTDQSVMSGAVMMAFAPCGKTRGCLWLE